MANRFWVGGGSANTWAATGNTNWALTSGAANNASVPGVGDVAIFDSNSGVSNSVIGANITVQGLDCTGGTGNYAGTITHNSAVTLTINTGAASSLRLSSGMTYTPAAASSVITLTHTTGTANITSNGQRLFALNINGVGGTTKPLDALLVNAGQNAILTLTNGIFDANGFAFTANLVSASNANTRSLILGSAVTIGGNVTTGQTIWNLATVTGLTFTKGSANIEVLAPTSPIEGVAFSGGGQTYNDLTLDLTSNQTGLSVAGANTFSHFVIAGGWNLFLPSSTTQTISSPFSWTGTQANPILVYSQAINTPATISCPSGACSLTWGGLQGITASGGASFTATNTFNFGTNSGFSIAPPADATTAAPTVAQIAAAVWQDTTAGHFTTAGSIGKDLFVGGIAPGAAGGHFIAGSNSATTVAITGNITGNLSGSVGSVTGLTASNLDATISSRMATYAQPTGFLAATFPSDPADQSLVIAATDALATLIGDVPTNAELATALGTADDAVLTAINDLPTNAELATALGTADDAVLSAIAGLDTKIDDLPTNAELATALGTADDAVLTAIGALPTADENADALLDRADGIETGLTPRQAMRLSAAADGGKLSGAATATNVIRNAVADDKDRITATVDTDGNRTAITYDLT